MKRQPGLRNVLFGAAFLMATSAIGPGFLTQTRLILPLALATVLWASRKRAIVGDYRHPAWLVVYGTLVVVVMSVLPIYTVVSTVHQI